MEYPTSRHDVYHVAFLLRQKLVADLVPIVLDEARYWTRSRVSTEKAVTVSDAPEGKRILRTAALTAEQHRRVRLVRFTTRSVAQCFDRSIWDRPQSPSCSNCGEQQNRQLTLGPSHPASPLFHQLHHETSSLPLPPPPPSDATFTVTPAAEWDDDDDEDDAQSANGSLNLPSTASHSALSTPSLSRTASSTGSLLSVPGFFDHFGSVNDGKADSNKNDAFTWFEAHVARSDAPDHLYPDTSSRHYPGPEAVRVGAPRTPGQLPEDGPRLMSNCNTEENLCTYEAEWRFDAEDDRDEKSMVRSLREGDVIDFTAHCSVFGWENFCKHAEVEIFFGHIRS